MKKRFSNINYAVNNNATVGLFNLVNDAKSRYEYKRCGSLIWTMLPLIERWDTQDCFNNPRQKTTPGNDNYRCQYDYACGYVN